MTSADCKRCKHFRSAPWQAKFEGCYHPDHLVVKQKVAYLDEQQAPGDHRMINRTGNCASFEAGQAPKRLPGGISPGLAAGAATVVLGAAGVLLMAGETFAGLIKNLF